MHVDLHLSSPALPCPPALQNPEAADKLSKIQRDLDETKVILHKTIESVLDRGEKLDQVRGQGRRGGCGWVGGWGCRVLWVGVADWVGGWRRSGPCPALPGQKRAPGMAADKIAAAASCLLALPAWPACPPAVGRQERRPEHGQPNVLQAGAQGKLLLPLHVNEEELRSHQERGSD